MRMFSDKISYNHHDSVDPMARLPSRVGNLAAVYQYNGKIAESEASVRDRVARTLVKNFWGSILPHHYRIESDLWMRVHIFTFRTLFVNGSHLFFGWALSFLQREYFVFRRFPIA